VALGRAPIRTSPVTTSAVRFPASRLLQPAATGGGRGARSGRAGGESPDRKFSASEYLPAPGRLLVDMTCGRTRSGVLMHLPLGLDVIREDAVHACVPRHPQVALKGAAGTPQSRRWWRRWPAVESAARRGCAQPPPGWRNSSPRVATGGAGGPRQSMQAIAGAKDSSAAGRRHRAVVRTEPCRGTWRRCLR
jgi:hypothetical protein